MKEKDIKKAYEKIKINASEKEKIFNNIMAKRKKAFNFKLAFSFGTVAFASFALFMMFYPNGRNISLENNYSRKIIVSAKDYLSSNEIDLNNLKNGEKIVIDAKKIINTKDYSSCSGNLTITKYNNDFSYSTNVTCSGRDSSKSSKKEFVIYDGILTNTFDFDDYIGIASYVNTDSSSFIIADSDANFTVLDNKGQVVFNTIIKSVFENENSVVNIFDAKKIGDDYYLIVEMTNDTYIEDNMVRSYHMNNYLVIIDKDGNIISTNQLVDKDLRPIILDSMYLIGRDETAIGLDDDSVYYTGYAAALEDDEDDEGIDYIIKVNKNGLETIPYKSHYIIEDTNIQNNDVICSYYNGYYYGYTTLLDSERVYHNNDGLIFKLDSEGNKLWSIDLGNGSFIQKMIVDKYIYLLDYRGYILVYDLDGNKVTHKELENIELLKLNNGKLNVVTSKKDYDGEIINYDLNILNSNLETEKVIEIDNSGLDNVSDYNSLAFWKLIDNKLTLVYGLVDKLGNSGELFSKNHNSVLIVYEK